MVDKRGKRIAALDLAATYADLKPEIDAAIGRVLASGRYIGGPEIEGLESEFAAFCGTPHAVAVASGTDALLFALMALGVGETQRRQRQQRQPDDEVITTPLTFIATSEAITQAGARPVFVDVEPQSLTIDPALVERAVTRHTRAILPVHLFGQTADMGPILDLARERGLPVVEDACQAHGALYRGAGEGTRPPGEGGKAAGRGTAAGRGSAPGRAAGALGDAGCFSFYPTKNMGAFGEAGMVTTGSADVAARVRRLRDHGQSEKYVHAEEGYNGRMDALQAAVLRVKLKRLAGWNARRRALAARYSERLKELSVPAGLPAEMPWGTHIYHLYTVRIEGDARRGGPTARDRVRSALLERGIETGVHYPIPLHLQPCYSWMGQKEGAFPVAERAAREVLSLPLYPEMTDGQVDRVCDALRDVLRDAPA